MDDLQMTAEMVSVLNPLVANKCYPLIAPDNTATPYITYHTVVNSPVVTLDDGVPINNTRMQIDCFASTYPEAKQLAMDIASAMQTASFKVVPRSTQDLYEDAMKIYRVSQDFSIWY